MIYIKPCIDVKAQHNQPQRPTSMATTSATLGFQAIHDRFRSRVFGYLTRLVGEAEAEDLTQAVMLKVSEGLPYFRGDSSLSTWIFRIATNAAMD
ncbi:MAG: hypothetical protein HY527_00780, partial [Betaproteobacteria bacterium]|nr:hypothetical protein [Betaproteobacteria bacterium]